jgi:hypothetical protein
MKRFANLACGIAIALVASAADPAVRMKPFHVTAGEVAFTVDCDSESQVVSAITVSGVVRGSGFERVGLRAGDHLIAVDGKQVVGRPLSDIFTADGELSKEQFDFTFRGRRGLFNRKSWEITLKISGKRPNKAREPTTLLVTRRADARVGPSRVVAHL